MSAASCLYGNVKKKVAPLVSLFWAPMMPPCISTSCLAYIHDSFQEHLFDQNGWDHNNKCVCVLHHFCYIPDLSLIHI